MPKKPPFGKKQKFTAPPKEGKSAAPPMGKMFGPTTPKKPEPDAAPRKPGGTARGARMARLSNRLI